jgi:methylmalonyl-CoA mutase N-terminal domain/subunit
VGVNEHVEEGEKIDIPILYIDESSERTQVEGLARIRAERNRRHADAALDDLRRAALGTENLLPPLLRAAHAYCTLGEIVGTLKGVFGEYHEPAFTL